MKRSILSLIAFIIISNIQILAVNHYDCEVVSYITSVKIIKNILIRENSFTYKVNNRQGEDYTDITIPYSKKNKISSLEAWIEDANHNIIRKITKSEIKDVSAFSAFSLYQDEYLKTFHLKHNQYPYFVHYEYSESFDEFIDIAGWSPEVNKAIPTLDAELKIEIPTNYPVKIHPKNISDYAVDTLESTIVYTWKSSYPDPISNEIYSPPFNDLVPCVYIAPLSFKYGVEGNYTDCISYGNWYYHLKENLNILPESERFKINNLTENVKDEHEIIKILYHYLQDNTRYINVKIDIGGFKPYSAEYVALNKYGDCKALSNYMMTMLEYKDVKSYYTEVYADENPAKIDTSFPGSQFNHIILFIPLKKDSIWLECTDKNIPVGYLGTFTQNRPAFVIEKDNSHFINTPPLKPDDVICRRNFIFSFNDYGYCTAAINFNMKGYYFEYFNELHEEANQKDEEENIRYSLPFKNYELIKWNLSKPDRDLAEINLTSTLSLTNFGNKIDTTLIVGLQQLDLPVFEVPGKRTLPVKINYPVGYQDSLYYKIPPGYKAGVLPDNIGIKSEFGQYKLTFTRLKDNVVVFRYFLLNAGEYSLDQYQEFYNFIASIKNEEKKHPLIFTSK